jgi:hypothetical protein
VIEWFGEDRERGLATDGCKTELHGAPTRDDEPNVELGFGRSRVAPCTAIPLDMSRWSRAFP